MLNTTDYQHYNDRNNQNNQKMSKERKIIVYEKMRYANKRGNNFKKRKK